MPQSARSWATESAAIQALPSIGTVVAVRYDPLNPERSVVWYMPPDKTIDVTLRWVVFYLNAVGVFIIIIGIIDYRRTVASQRQEGVTTNI